MKKKDQPEFGIRSERGELYLLTKKERLLTIEILKMALATEGGRGFLLDRFGKGGMEIVVHLLEQMGVQTGNPIKKSHAHLVGEK